MTTRLVGARRGGGGLSPGGSSCYCCSARGGASLLSPGAALSGRSCAHWYVVSHCGCHGGALRYQSSGRERCGLWTGVDFVTRDDEDMRETDYCVDIKTLCLASLGFCPAPVELQTRFAMRQFEHGDSLSHRICVLLVHFVSALRHVESRVPPSWAWLRPRASADEQTMHMMTSAA